MEIHANGSNPSIARIEELVRRVEALRDPAARAAAIELVAAVMEFHAEAVARMVEILASQAAGEEIARLLSSDELVSSLLALHGQHPDDVETRVRAAVDKLSHYFDPRGARLVLLGLDNGAARLRFTGSRSVTGADARKLIESALYQIAPELSGLLIEGIEETRQANFVPLSQLAVAEAR